VRVALLSPYPPTPEEPGDPSGLAGGVEASLAGSAAALAKRGHDVTLWTTARRPYTARTPEGVRVEAVRRFASAFRAPLSSLAWARLDADVVHVPATYPTMSDLVPLLSRVRGGPPVVVDYHFDVAPTSTAMALATNVYGSTLGRAMAAARLVVHRSPEPPAGLGRLVSRVPTVHVPNGVDVARFRPASRREGYVLFVGRLVPYKGVSVLLSAMRRVQARRPAPLVVAGDGPLRDGLEDLARNLGVDATFLGRVDDETLATLYAKAAVTVLPSVNTQEAFGVALLESLASGTPVVASDLPGVRHVASLGGLVARPGDAQDLAGRIVDVLEGRAALPSANDLRRAVARRYAWPVVAKGLEEAYRAATEPAP